MTAYRHKIFLAAALAFSSTASANDATPKWDDTKLIPASQQTAAETGVVNCARKIATELKMQIDLAGVTAPYTEIGDHNRGAPYISASRVLGTTYYTSTFLTRHGGVELSVSDYPLNHTNAGKPFYRIDASGGTNKIWGGFKQGDDQTASYVRAEAEEFAKRLTKCARVLGR